VVEPFAAGDLEPWLAAARAFRMNTDFDVPSARQVHKQDLPSLMAALKTESEGKATIQALADKLLLSGMMENLGVPQMPVLLAVRDVTKARGEVVRFLEERLLTGDPRELVVKPTHLSNAEGVVCLRPIAATEFDVAVQSLVRPMERFMAKRADERESRASPSIAPWWASACPWNCGSSRSGVAHGWAFGGGAQRLPSGTHG